MRRYLLTLALAGCAEGGAVAGGEGPRGGEADAAAPAVDAAVAPDAAEGPAEAIYSLRLNDDPPAPLTLALDRDDVEALLGPVADQIVLLTLDTTPLLVDTLERVKSACGTDWRADHPDPRHDCEKTELGRTFRGSDGTWRTSAEYSLVRLLTMTPANAVVEGTSIEFLQLLADEFGIGGGFAQILAENLEIERTEEFLTTDEVVRSLRQNLLETHPAVGSRGRIAVTLRDALTDLRTLGERLGPQGAHPGVVDPAVPTRGVVLGPEFAMHLTVDSNIRLLEGIDLSAGKEYLATVVDTVGPTFDDPVELDFSDPERFFITGLAERPTLDLKFDIYEADVFVPACTGAPCQANRPDSPVGAGTVWHLPPWRLEYIIAWAGVAKYDRLVHRSCYLSCAAAEVAVGQGDDPPGWAHFGVPLELGPKDQYVWELINEVAQVGLHRTPYARLDEGEGDVSFTVAGVDCGIDGAEAAEAVRPWLQRQSRLIGDSLLGDFRARSGAVDLYYRRGEQGAPALYFVAPEDLDPDAAYGWARPGFYGDSDLTEKVSTTTLDGHADTLREKLALPPGQALTVYAEDDEGGVYRLEVAPGDGAAFELDVRVVRVR